MLLRRVSFFDHNSYSATQLRLDTSFRFSDASTPWYNYFHTISPCSLHPRSGCLGGGRRSSPMGNEPLHQPLRDSAFLSWFVIPVSILDSWFSFPFRSTCLCVLPLAAGEWLEGAFPATHTRTHPQGLAEMPTPICLCCTCMHGVISTQHSSPTEISAGPPLSGIPQTRLWAQYTLSSAKASSFFDLIFLYRSSWIK